MIKNTIFANYLGNQYEITMNNGLLGDEYHLISSDSKDLQNGFELRVKHVIRSVSGKVFEFEPNKSDPPIYFKIVTKNDVEYVYSIHTFGIYKGHKFRIGRQQQAGQLVLITSDNDLVIPLNMETRDRGYYVKMVDESEVTLFEEKELMPNFFGEND